MSEISDRCRNFAALVRAWAAFELSGPVPARLDYDELANTLNLAADEIIELEKTGER